MRVIAALLLLACLPALSAATRLSDADVLGRLDEAAASEARWILRARLFATGAVGIGGGATRAGIAYQRLLRGGEVSVFETLALSSNDVAVCFAIEGIAELAPVRLPALLADVILRRDAVEEASGCIGGTTCAFSELASAILRHGGVKERLVFEAAWLSFLEVLGVSEAQCTDPWVVRSTRELLGSVPMSNPEPAALAYVLAFVQESEEGPQPLLRKLARGVDGGASARLALQWLASGKEPRVQSDLLEQVWAGELNDAEVVLDLQITAEYWDRVARGLLPPSRDFLFADRYDCPWHGLTETDWAWLVAHEDVRVREAGERLRANPIAGWRIDAPLPTETDARAHAVLCLLRAATTQGGAQQQRAEAALKRLLKRDASLLPLGLIWDSSETLEEVLAEAFGEGWLRTIAIEAAASAERPVHSAGIRLLAATLNHKNARALMRGDLSDTEVFETLLARLWTACEETSSPDCWEVRLLTLRIVDGLWMDKSVHAEKRDAARDRWLAEFGRLIVNNPRQMPPQFDWFAMEDQASLSDARAAQLVESILDGRDHFMPDDELPTDTPEEERAPTAALIYKWMKEAVAKLE